MSQRLDSAAEIFAAAREILPWMFDIRRDLHPHPELGLEEHRSAEVKIEPSYDPLINDNTMVEIVRSTMSCSTPTRTSWPMEPRSRCSTHWPY